MTICDKKGDMVYRGDAVLGSLYLNPTRYCNLRCAHCWVSPPYSDKPVEDGKELSIDEMIGIVREAGLLGLANLKLTGGEPLLREGIERLIEFSVSSGIAVWIETNGTLITEKMARMFKDVGVSDISVSIDSHLEERHDALRGKKGAFRKAVEGVRNLIREGMSPEIIISLYRENIPGFQKFLEFMTGLGVRRIKINTISPVGRGAGLEDTGFLPDIKETLDFYAELGSRCSNFSGSVYLDMPMAFKSIDDLKGGRCSICGLKNILGVLSDGSVSMCGIGFVDEKMVFGNIKGRPETLREIWMNAPVLKKIREEVPLKLEGVCGMCAFRNICLGDCRAEVFYNTGSLTAPSSFCQAAYDRGLFPSTRLLPGAVKA